MNQQSDSNGGWGTPAAWEPPPGAAPLLPGEPPPTRRGQSLVAWIVIVIVCVAILTVQPVGPEPTAAGGGETIELVLMELQSKYLIGASRLPTMQPGLLYSQAHTVLNVGTVEQRQRFIIVANELAGPEQARQALEKLDELLADPPVGDPVELTEDEASLRRILFVLYPPLTDEESTTDDDPLQDKEPVPATVTTLSEDDQRLLVDHLGWFGELALAPPGIEDRSRRDAVLAPASTVAIAMFVLVALAVLVGAGGFVGLVIVLVLVMLKTIRGGVASGRGAHGIYAETFAVWMVLFIALQLLLAEAPVAPGLRMPLTIVAFFVSLIALLWPVLRGVSWHDVRHDIGWTLGRRPLLEPLFAFGGYAMTLPLLAVGVALMLMLIFLQQTFAAPPSTFAPAGPPAHPIILDLAGAAWWPKVQILFLAAVAAPIVEETMFRGVLYRHLRGGTAGAGMALSVLLSTTINAFIFAIIHPQGWVAVPALMSLAFGFALVREWRDTVLPSMIMHSINNGVLITVMIIALSA